MPIPDHIGIYGDEKSETSARDTENSDVTVLPGIRLLRMYTLYGMSSVKFEQIQGDSKKSS